MAEWKRMKIGQFLKEREGRYDPNDETVQNLKRLNKINFSGEIHLSDKDSKTDMIIVKPGDLVISGINVSKGALAVYHGDEPITATIHYSSYVFDKKQINIDYFKRFVKSQSFIQALKDQVKGGIKTEIKSKHFLPLEIDLPDINSQKELVSFFNGVENEMDELSGEITHQQAYLKKLRQQVLQEAIEGKLTTEWRTQNPELIRGENHASKLLEKIKAEKDRLIKKGEIKKGKPLSPITEAEKPFALPDGWAWCRLREIALNIHYGFNASAVPAKKDVRLLRITDIQNNKVDWESVPGCLYAERDLKSYLLFENDIVIARTGGTIGKSFLIKNIPVKSLFASYLIRVIPSRNILPEYLKIFLESPEYWKQLYDVAWGAGQPNVNGTALSSLKVSYPSIAEQQAIVERVEKLMAMINELEKQVAERKNQSGMLMQSVLREAFAG